jgi:hypothetical protein
MKFAGRIRKLALHGILVGAFALSIGLGFGPHGASASKTVAVTSNCDDIMAAAMYAGNQYLSASRRGDSISADWWWSIYEYNETRYRTSGCLDQAV